MLLLKITNGEMQELARGDSKEDLMYAFDTERILLYYRGIREVSRKDEGDDVFIVNFNKEGKHFCDIVVGEMVVKKVKEEEGEDDGSEI